MTGVRAYEEIIDFLAAGTSSREIAEYRPSAKVRQRVSELIAREKAVGLNTEEAAELQSYFHLEHIMRLAKARARRHLVGKA